MEIGMFAQCYVREGRDAHHAFEESLALAQLADDLGVDCYWLAELHFRPHTPLSAPLVLGSSIAARTKRLKVGIGVQLLPLANPLRLAEECATLDHLTEGRLIYGIGRSSFVDGYQGYGVDYEDSRPMFFEALEVLRKAWGDEPFSFEGEYFNFRDVNVIPKPFQRPHPPIRIACESRASFPMMGKFGFPILMRHQMELSELAGLLQEYEDERRKAGFGGPNNVTLQMNCYLAESDEKAREGVEYSALRDRQIARQYQGGREGDSEAAVRLGRLRETQSLEELSKRALYTTPEQAVDRLQEYRETIGITGVSLNMNPGGQIPYEQVVNSLRLLMDRVAPRLN
jgi:alkanesulfonate monooxygenase SsuD/methylene tetrahydromethanopterin reductase-like flavin-dependent oxidoreductase (luciferase family)